MQDSVLKSIAIEKYFTLLRGLCSAACGFAVCDKTGRVQQVSADAGQLPTGHRLSMENCKEICVTGDEKRLLSVRPGGDAVGYAMEINTWAGDGGGYLVVFVTVNCAEDKTLQSIIVAALDTVCALLEKEVRLTAELDSMATELASRYEELNLAYETSDEATLFDQEDKALNTLVRHCVEYLDVGMTFLLLPQQEKIYIVSNFDAPIDDPHNIVTQFQGALLNYVQQEKSCLLINNSTDQLRKDLDIKVPYKVLATPVMNARDEVDGVLICLNHENRADFFNSDKNLLSVMARKVARIIQTHYDMLTGLMNLTSFESIINTAIESAREKGLLRCVLNIDIDQLQIINDRYGRGAGDTLIRDVALSLQNKLRNTDAIAYLGEGKYGVLLEHCPLDQGMKVAENLRQLVDGTEYFWMSEPLSLSVTIGVAVIDSQTGNVDTVIEAAELARDTAKEVGRNRIHYYQQNDVNLVARKEHMQWVTRIQAALRENHFQLYCQTIQPVVDNTEKYHMEILLRLQDKDGSTISPFKFIPPAEQYNLMSDIDRWVINCAFSELSNAGMCQVAGEGVVSINLSGQSLDDDDLVYYISQKMVHYGIHSSCICFEITETAAIGNLDVALAVINRIKALGCHFSLDDFGTGLSSFSYLKTLPVDYVKIDGSFVRNMIEDRISHVMVSSINDIAHVMGLKTIAEFVEDDALIEHLSGLGIDYLQGYAIDEPAPLQGYLAQLRQPLTGKQAG